MSPGEGNLPWGFSVKRTLVTAAAALALSVEEFKVHARIDDTEEDTLISSMLSVAEQAAENFTWRKFVTQTWDEFFDGFDDPLYLSFAPVQSVTSVSYVDENGATQTLSSSIYELGSEYDVPLIRRKYNQVWPTTRTHEDVVTVRYVVGYTSVPARIQQAIAIHAAWQYRNREGSELFATRLDSFPETFYALLRPFRLQRFMAIGER